MTAGPTGSGTPSDGPVATVDGLVSGPALEIRGIVEGFYGPPWTHEDRLDTLRFAGRHGLTTYVYAPKDDPVHRASWRDLYSPDVLAKLGRLASVARDEGVTFVYAISPGLSMVHSEAAEHASLRRKVDQLRSVGIEDFALFFDDLPDEFPDSRDVDAFPAGPGQAHGETCRRFVDGVLRPYGVMSPLLMVPTDYAGTGPSPYREALASTLPDDALVLWTGHDIVVGEITREHIDAAAASYRRRLVIWDNFPVNDFDPSRIFLGPLRGRPGDLEGSGCVGLLANPMIAAAPSLVALATVADYGADPSRYDPDISWAAVLKEVGGAMHDDLVVLARTLDAWPPSAPRAPELAAQVAAVLVAVDGTGPGTTVDPVARATLARFATAFEKAGARLASCPPGVDGSPSARLLSQLRPWSLSLAAAGTLLSAVCRTLGPTTPDGVRALVACRSRVLLARADVLRPDLLELADAVLAKASTAPHAVPGKDVAP